MGFHLSERGKGVGFGREVGVRRLVIIVGSGSLCSLQLCWGAAALLPAAQKLASLEEMCLRLALAQEGTAGQRNGTTGSE